MNKDDDTIIITTNDVTLDISDYGAAQSVYTIEPIDTLDIGNIDWNNMNSTITAGSSDTLTWSDSNYQYNFGTVNPKVSVDSDGLQIKDGGDITIGDRSMKEFMDKVEDQLAILRPAPELEERWDQLKDLRKQYESLKQDILEKEKIMKILKED